MSDVLDLKAGPRSQQSASIAMTLVLMSWAVAFIALFMGYALIRARQAQWPPVGAPSLGVATPILNTIFALTSSVAFQRALNAVRVNRQPELRRWLAIAAALGTAFMTMQILNWTTLWGSGLQAGTSLYAGMFYMLTWFHAAHVVMGLGVVAVIAPRVWRGAYDGRAHLPIKFAAWFWHFVTTAWVGVLLALYVF